MAALFSELWIALLYADQPTHPRVAQLDRMARRIAFNRVVAGVHFPVDNAAGYALGQQLAALFVAWACPQGVYAKPWCFAPEAAGNGVEKQPELSEAGERQAASLSEREAPRLPLLGWMWDRAAAELAALRL